MQDSDNEIIFDEIYDILSNAKKFEDYELVYATNCLRPIVRRNPKHYPRIKQLRDRLYKLIPDDKRIPYLNKILKHARGSK